VLQAFAQTRFGGRLDLVLQAFAQTRFGGRLNVFPAFDRPLLGTKWGGAIVLIASKAGAPRHPAWFYNLRAHPDVEVTVRGDRRPVRARVAAGEERDRLWQLACDHYSGYAAYQTRTGRRVVPVVVLEPSHVR
jgi:deazaflavin-dependent oxidoreductase (nitroreductase family)